MGKNNLGTEPVQTVTPLMFLAQKKAISARNRYKRRERERERERERDEGMELTNISNAERKLISAGYTSLSSLSSISPSNLARGTTSSLLISI